MKAQIYKLLLLLIFSVTAIAAFSTVSEYSFASTLGTFTEISGGTIHGTSANDNECFCAIPLGFTFTYNGVDYTTISIASNGFIAMGDTVVTSTVPISSSTSTNNVIAVLARDLKSRADGTLMSLSSGTAPNRVFTIQWKNWRRTPTATANDDFTFQIQLQENGNKVVFVYGPFTAVTAATSATVQVGLRGDSNNDFNNRTTTTDWSATTAGTANNSTCTLSATVFPANGLTFTFAPPIIGEPPLAAQNPHPANGAINVPIATNLSWNTGGGLVEGYKVYFGTDNPPTNIENGTIQTTTVYDPVNDLTYSTTYYWKIIPYNQFGDAINCPVWSFTVLADPTVTTYPYEQNFDSVTPPDLALGWTVINANNDTYTWQSYNGNSQTSPNSMRVRYNSTLAMDDWLFTPPLVFTNTHNYKIKFYYCSSSATYPEKLSVYWGTTPAVASMTNLLWENLNIINTAYEAAEIIMPAVTGGTYYIGFHGHSDADRFYLYIDTFSVSDIVEQINPPQNLTATIQNYYNVHLAWQAPVSSLGTRALLGYKVYRDGSLINTISNPATLTYDDLGLEVGTYSYTVTAYYTTGESVPAGPVSVEIVAPLDPPLNLTATVQNNTNVFLDWDAPGVVPPPTGFSDGFETYTDFSISFAPWTLVDVDQSTTYGMQGISWTNAYAAQAYIIFNPSATTPAITDLTAHTGNKMAACFASTVPPNNDWMITPQLSITAGNVLKFWARSYTEQYGLERFKVGVSTTGTTPANFTIISGTTYIQAPVTWTEYTYDLSSYAGQNVYIGIQCVSNDAFIFLVDDVFIGAPATAKSYPYVASVSGTNDRVKGVSVPTIRQETKNNDRALLGYKVYRNGTLISTINNPAITDYTDLDLANGLYTYGVTALYTTGESVPATVSVTINYQPTPAFFTDDFESYANFVTTFAPWTTVDVDLADTYGIQDVNFPGSGGAMAYIIFNPSATVPPLTTLTAHSGSKMPASFAATTPPNNDWMISPRVFLGTGSFVKFYARSYTAQYGLERFKVGVSTTTPNPANFQIVSGATYVQAPVTWTEYTYDLSSYDNQNVYIGIQCLSNDAFIFFVDDVSIHGVNGYDNNDNNAPVVQTELKGNYPNPFNPETTIAYSVKEHIPVNIEIYNIKGQKVKTLVSETKAPGNYTAVWRGLDDNNHPVSSGVYFFKMNAGKYSSTKKMIMMK